HPRFQIKHVIGQAHDHDDAQCVGDPPDGFVIAEHPAEEMQVAGHPQPGGESGDNRQPAELDDRLLVLVPFTHQLVAGKAVAQRADNRGEQEGDRKAEGDEQYVCSHALVSGASCPRSRMPGTTTCSSSMEIAPERTTERCWPVQSMMVDGSTSSPSSPRGPPSRYTSTESPSCSRACSMFSA